MKKIIVLIFGVLANVNIHAQSALQEHQLHVTIKARGDIDAPVPDAKVWVAYDMTTNLISGLTDTNGIYLASRFCRSIELEFHAEKEGYYPFSMQHQLGYYYK